MFHSIAPKVHNVNEFFIMSQISAKVLDFLKIP